MREMVFEVCPECGYEMALFWDMQEGHSVFCPSCGRRDMLCSECPATNDKASCDWSEDDPEHMCFWDHDPPGQNDETGGERKEMTNAERIGSMGFDELLDFLFRFNDGAYHWWGFCEMCDGNGTDRCRSCLETWLRTFSTDYAGIDRL